MSSLLTRARSRSHVDLYQGTHKQSRLGNILYNASLGACIVLASATLLASGYDVLQQVIVASRGQIRFSDTAITGGAYLVVGIISTCIVFSRLYTGRRVLGSIPKGYIPVGKDELNKNLYRLVASEYTRCAMIVHATRPRGRVLPGWGAPGGDYAGIRFRSAILQTTQVLDAVIPPTYLTQSTSTSSPSSPSTPRRPIPTSSRPASPLAKYLPLLQGDNPIVPKTLLPLLQLYEKHLEDAKWKAEEPTQEAYENCLRIVAVLVDVIGKRTGVAAAAGAP